jgi:hypothetical protein
VLLALFYSTNPALFASLIPPSFEAEFMGAACACVQACERACPQVYTWMHPSIHPPNRDGHPYVCTYMRVCLRMGTPLCVYVHACMLADGGWGKAHSPKRYIETGYSPITHRGSYSPSPPPAEAHVRGTHGRGVGADGVSSA